MGEQLLKDIVDATGLPQQELSSELAQMIIAAGQNPATVTLEDLRDILVEFAQDVLLAAKDDFKATGS